MSANKNYHRVEITGVPRSEGFSVKLDGLELHGISELALKMAANEPPYASFTLYMGDVQVDSEFMVYLKGKVLP